VTEPVTIRIGIANQSAPEGRLRVGLIGHGIQLSRTPDMHVAEGATLGLDYCYDLIDTDQKDGDQDITEFLNQAEADNFRGVNVTHPFKQAAMDHLDHLSDAARAVNAVNTVVFQNGKRFGHNTDYWGFSEAFRLQLADVAPGRVLLFGAGGAGGAVANALLDNGVAHLAIFDPDTEAKMSMVQRLEQRVGSDRVSAAGNVPREIQSADGLVNASPIGMESHPGSPIPADSLCARHWVADIIYFPLETELLAAARARGCRTMDGSGMAVFQAVRAFELFTGVKPDPDRMRATFNAFVPLTAGSSGI
jgi:quinate/shikimate dehydrogenase (NAD+)